MSRFRDGDGMNSFMAGRYGNDNLNRFMLYVCIALLVVDIFVRSSFLYLIPIVLLCIIYFRMLSRNVEARYAENERYLRVRDGFLGIFRRGGRGQAQAGYRIYVCPKCRQKIRIPKGKGRIKIRCPRCGHEFIKRS